MSKNILMKRMMALDFMAIDIGLFLDTHPDDRKAIETYNAVIEEGRRVRCEYEEEYEPVSPAKASGSDCWSWISEPWPWEYEANFCMRGED